MATVNIVLATFQPNLVFFQKQVFSILAQTYQDFRLIISDDSIGSEVHDWINQNINDTRCTYIRNEPENNGVVGNFSHALKHRDNDCHYIFFSDQDDLWVLDKIERVVSTFETNTDALVIHHDLELIDQNDNLITDSCWNYEKRDLYPKNIESLIVSNIATGCAMAVKANFCDLFLPFPLDSLGKTPLFLHDHWICCLAYLNNGLVSLPDKLTKYRQHDDNVVGARSSKINLNRAFKLRLNSLVSKGEYAYQVRRSLALNLLERSSQQQHRSVQMSRWYKKRLNLFDISCLLFRYPTKYVVIFQMLAFTMFGRIKK